MGNKLDINLEVEKVKVYYEEKLHNMRKRLEEEQEVEIRNTYDLLNTSLNRQTELEKINNELIHAISKIANHL